jgi:hypothetical protein
LCCLIFLHGNFTAKEPGMRRITSLDSHLEGLGMFIQFYK